ncbi:MAG: sigma 54-interacting transcriptional regulator [Candidatus Tectomicrobia bacterium]
MRPFVDTSEIPVPPGLIDQVLGQEEASAVIRQAAMQRRHVLLIGVPGTGKSLLGQAMAELTKVDSPEDILVFPGPQDQNRPDIRRLLAGQGAKHVAAHQTRMHRASASLRLLLWTVAASILLVSVYFAIRERELTYLIGGLLGLALVFWLRQYVLRSPSALVPKLLVQHPSSCAPFVDATGLHAGALLGDVRHDPYQSGGVETPPHHLVEAGAIHRAHGGVLYIDEVSLLGLDAQHHLLTAMQERQFAITGRSQGSSGTMVHTAPVPCDFTLVLAGNIEDLPHIHPALRSRIRGYGYEIYTHVVMADTDEHRWLIARLVAQEIRRDGKIPHCSAAGVRAVIDAARQRAGQPGTLSCRFRELGGLIRIAGDFAIREGARLITASHVNMALKWNLPIEEQMVRQQMDVEE